VELTSNEALRKGVEAHEAGQIQEAYRLYTYILKVEPKHPDANHNMGVLAVGIGKAQTALPFFKTALESNASIGQFWLSYIGALIKLGLSADAQAAFNQARDKVAKGEVFNQLEQQLVEQGLKVNETNIMDMKGSRSSKSSILDTIKLDKALRLAKRKSKEGQLEKAKSIYEDILQKFPRNKKALIAHQLLAGGTIVTPQEPPSGQLQPIINLYTQGQLQPALSNATKMMERFPNSVVLYHIAGASNAGLKQFDTAINCYKQALKINPNNAETHYNMSTALMEKGDLEEAIKSYKQTLKIKPDHARAYNNMGNALMEKGDLEASIKSYKQALKFKPDYVDVWNNLQYPLQAMKLQATAIEELLPTFNPKEDFKRFQIAKAVLNYRLHLGEVNAERSLNEVCSLLSTADNAIIKNPEGTKNDSHQRVIGPDKIVALVAFGRSGTGLLHSLIDGHPEVSTLPSIYLSEFFNPSNWEKIVLGEWSEMADRFIATYEVLFDASVRSPIATKSNKLIDYMGQKEGMANVGNKRDEVLRVDKALFRKELRRLMNLQNHLDAYGFFKLVHAAYDKTLNDHGNKHLIFYHIHNPDTYAKLNFVHTAPNANWVMLVREPLQACESWIKNHFYGNEYAETSTKIIMMLFQVDNIVYQKQNATGVRLEDLKESPRKTIPALCDWMGIEETESLYEMTAQGKRWWGDPVSPDYEKDGMKPFGKTSIKRKVGAVFTGNDQFILRTLFYPFSVRFGYVEENLEQFKADLKTIRPMLDEMFGFEKTIAERTQVDAEQFIKSGSYLYLRSCLIDRWNVLSKFHTYPNMIKPLNINQLH